LLLELIKKLNNIGLNHLGGKSVCSADLGNDLDGIFPLPEPLEYQGADSIEVKDLSLADVEHGATILISGAPNSR